MTNSDKVYAIFKMGRKWCFNTKNSGLVKQGTLMEAEANSAYYRRVEAQ